MISTAWPAPAKLNLFLHILGRRADGYHRLQTLFQFLDYGDELDFKLTRDGRITRQRALPGVAAEQDLCLRAARLLQPHAVAGAGVCIDLRKRLPLGGGIGGGSSDAATVLVALNRLWGCGLRPAELAGLGLQLGADVPVFLHGQAAWAEGVGEVLRPVSPAEPWYVLALPPVAVSTAAVFAAPELTRDTPPMTMTDFLSGAGHNDCEPWVRRRYPLIDLALRVLGEYGPARLTGTGSTVFLPCPDARVAAGVRRVAAARLAMPLLVARGMNRSPLMDRLARVGAQAGRAK